MTSLALPITHADVVNLLLEKAQATTAWSDKQAASMLVLLADILGDIGEADSTATILAAREAFINIARRSSSIYAGARILGVPIRRKSSAVTTVYFTNNTGEHVTYERNTQVSVGGRPAFLTQQLSLAPGASQNCTVAIGSVVNERYPITETIDLRRQTLGTDGFRIASDIEVWTEDANGNAYPYTLIDQGLTRAGVGDPVVADVTDETGTATLLFGGQYFGYAPPRDHTLCVRYRVTNGQSDNNDNVGLICEVIDNKRIAGRTIEPVVGGDNELPLEYYKVFGPILHLSRGSLNRPDEWRAAVLSFPGVADCAIMSQRDIAPNDPTWQLMLRICVLPKSGATFGGINPNPESAAWTRLLNMIAKYKPSHTIQTWNPSRILTSVAVEIGVHDWYSGDYRSLEQAAQTKVANLFRPRVGLLGRMLSHSDIVAAIKNDDDGRTLDYIDYVRVLSPSDDLKPGSKLEYIGLRSMQVVAVTSNRGDSYGSYV